MSTALTLSHGELDRYLAEVTRHPLLSREEELALARRWRDEQDVGAAHALVVANLRFVVKIAHEYRGYGLKLLDLIQEGNVGLMHAVKKFDPDRGYRLISYAVWWIRAQIHEFIMRSWSLVKLGSGRLKRRLFFKLRAARARLTQEQGQDGEAPSADAQVLAARLGVGEELISEMEMRLAARDFSLDAPVSDGATTEHLDLLVDDEPSAEEQLDHARGLKLLHGAIAETAEGLDEKERYILENRLLSDEPATLADIGRRYGVSRERARQLESRLVDKLRIKAQELAAAPA